MQEFTVLQTRTINLLHKMSPNSSIHVDKGKAKGRAKDTLKHQWFSITVFITNEISTSEQPCRLGHSTAGREVAGIKHRVTEQRPQCP